MSLPALAWSPQQLVPSSTHPVVDVDVHVPVQQHDDDVGVATHAGQGQSALPLLRQHVGVSTLGTAQPLVLMGEGAETWGAQHSLAGYPTGADCGARSQQINGAETAHTFPVTSPNQSPYQAYFNHHQTSQVRT